MDRIEEAEQVVKSHVLWASGAGLVPIPIFDIAAVTAVQIGMLEQLCALFEAKFSHSSGKIFVSALTGGTFAKLGASLIKAIPGVGSLVGGLSMAALSGASTYAVGKVAIEHLDGQTELDDIDLDAAKRAYEAAFEEGKDAVQDAGKEGDDSSKPGSVAADVFDKLQKLGELRDEGLVTEDEFKAKKRELLSRI